MAVSAEYLSCFHGKTELSVLVLSKRSYNYPKEIMLLPLLVLAWKKNSEEKFIPVGAIYLQLVPPNLPTEITTEEKKPRKKATNHSND